MQEKRDPPKAGSEQSTRGGFGLNSDISQNFWNFWNFFLVLGFRVGFY
jgi:hypothetical protein